MTVINNTIYEISYVNEPDELCGKSLFNINNTEYLNKLNENFMVAIKSFGKEFKLFKKSNKTNYYFCSYQELKGKYFIKKIHL